MLQTSNCTAFAQSLGAIIAISSAVVLRYTRPMKVRVRFEVAGKEIDEIAEGKDADDLLAQAKARVAAHLGWKGLFLNVMSPLEFARLAVKMYNEHHETSFPVPESAADFVEFGKKTGNLTVLEE